MKKNQEKHVFMNRLWVPTFVLVHLIFFSSVSYCDQTQLKDPLFELTHSETTPGFIRYTPQHLSLNYSFLIPGEWKAYEDLRGVSAVHLTPEHLENHQDVYSTGISLFQLNPPLLKPNDTYAIFKEIDKRTQGLIKNGFQPVDGGIIRDTLNGYWIEYRKSKHRYFGAYVFNEKSAVWICLKSPAKQFTANKVIFDEVIISLEFSGD